MKKSCKNKLNGFLAYLNKGSFKKFLIVGVLSLPVVLAFNSCSKNSSVESLASSVSGTGDTDEVIQNKTRSVDILFLVENSSGDLIQEKIKKLASKTDVFSRQLDSHNIDWNIAVTGIDPYKTEKTVKLSPLTFNQKEFYYKTTGGCIVPKAYVLKKNNFYKAGKELDAAGLGSGCVTPGGEIEVVSLENLSNQVKQRDTISLPTPSRPMISGTTIARTLQLILPILPTPQSILAETISSVGEVEVESTFRPQQGLQPAIPIPFLPNSLSRESRTVFFRMPQGITSLMDFLSQKDTYPQNDFLRKNSLVSVIVISDSDEMFFDDLDGRKFLNTQEREALLSNFVDKKVEALGAQQSFQFHSITASKDSYCGGQGVEDLRAGKAYRELSETDLPEKGIVQGLARNICEPDYSSILSDIADSIADNLK